MEFSFSIDVIQPHPYFLIRPLHGVVPANGSVAINISFHPITLGTCTSVIRLFIAEHNFQPIETVVNARAVSGMIEQKTLKQAEDRISTLLSNKTLEISQRFGQTTFGTTLPPQELTMGKEISPRTSKIKSKEMKSSIRRTQNSISDPVTAVLKKTFSADGVEPTLKSALLKPSEDGTLLLGSKVPSAIESGPLHGMKKLIGNLKSTQPVQPRGVGSGNVFDTGTEFISNEIKLCQRKKPGNRETDGNEKVVEGLRIPQNLNTIASVNFVLTQESGKLKPKDLKVAIERNRDERRKQEIEQARIRDENGGGTGAGFDVRAILADERLNSEQGNAFKRQLREMAFLSDVENTKKEEVEKTFRVSEEFIGSTILSPHDLEIIQTQRKSYRRHRNRTDWRAFLNRTKSVNLSPQSDIRAAPPTPTAQFPQNLLSNDSNLILRSAPPSFDSNKNDIWSKRMNTLRNFINLVSRWIVQRRVDKRLDMLKQRLVTVGVVDRETAKAFVEADTSSPSTGMTNLSKSSQLAAEQTHLLAPSAHTLASLVCSLPDQALERLKHADRVQNAFAPTTEMCRRVLFPKYIADEVAVRKPIEAVPVHELLSFDDRTFFPLKNRVEYLDLGYKGESTSHCPVFFPPMSKLDLSPRTGAPEESTLRSSVGFLYSSLDIESLTTSGCDRVFTLSAFAPPPFAESIPLVEDALESSIFPSPPVWLIDRPELASRGSSSDRDLSLIRPQLRIFTPDILSQDMELDWVLRPTISKYQDDIDSTLRTRSLLALPSLNSDFRLLSLPGFDSAQTYLLGGYKGRVADFPIPSSTITDFYLPDSDIHGSGLCCSSLDHRTALADEEFTMTSLHQKLSREDYLTDSESDDDEVYPDLKPTFSSVRDILHPLAKEVVQGGNCEKKPTKLAHQTQVLDSHDGESVLDLADRKFDQVELMRDRKTLEHATHLRQFRESNANLLINRYFISFPSSFNSFSGFKS